MSRWMVNASGHQYSAASIDELKKLAKEGKFFGGDILQPPGASEWIYALELPELKTVLGQEFDGTAPASEMSPVVRWGLAGVLAIAAAGCWVYAYGLSQDMPNPNDLELIGGESGLQFNEVLVTANPAPLFASEGSSNQVGTLPKNSKANLLGKRGDWYHLSAGGVEGYAHIIDVIPAYFFAGPATQLQYKPFYYPDQFVTIVNSSWSLVPENGNTSVTNFIFMVGNDSQFGMTALKLKASIKDKDGKVLEEKEVVVEGVIKPNSSTMIGSLKADKKDKKAVDRVMTEALFTELMASDPKLIDRWVEGVDIKLESTGFDGATISVAEVLAVPPDGAAPK